MTGPGVERPFRPSPALVQLLLKTEGTISHANAEWTHFSGFSEQESVGSLLYILYHAEVDENMAGQTSAAIAEGREFSVRLLCSTKDLAAFIGEFRFTSVEDVASGATTYLCTVLGYELTEETRRSQHAPRFHSSSPAADLSSRLDEAVVFGAHAQMITDPQEPFNLQGINAAWSALTGFDQQEVVGKSADTCFSGPADSLLVQTLERAANEGAITVQLALYNKGRDRFRYVISVRLLFTASNELAGIGCVSLAVFADTAPPFRSAPTAPRLVTAPAVAERAAPPSEQLPTMFGKRPLPVQPQTLQPDVAKRPFASLRQSAPATSATLAQALVPNVLHSGGGPALHAASMQPVAAPRFIPRPGFSFGAQPAGSLPPGVEPSWPAVSGADGAGPSAGAAPFRSYLPSAAAAPSASEAASPMAAFAAQSQSQMAAAAAAAYQSEVMQHMQHMMQQQQQQQLCMMNAGAPLMGMPLMGMPHILGANGQPLSSQPEGEAALQSLVAYQNPMLGGHMMLGHPLLGAHPMLGGHALALQGLPSSVAAATLVQRTGGSHRAVRKLKRVPFSPEEEEYVKRGYAEFKNDKFMWRSIVDKYPFHPSRTSVDIKDKWRNIQKKRLATQNVQQALALQMSAGAASSSTDPLNAPVAASSAGTVSTAVAPAMASQAVSAVPYATAPTLAPDAPVHAVATPTLAPSAVHAQAVAATIPAPSSPWAAHRPTPAPDHTEVPAAVCSLSEPVSHEPAIAADPTAVSPALANTDERSSSDAQEDAVSRQS